MIHILSSVVSMGDRFHVSRKGETGSQEKVGGFPQSVKTAQLCPSLTVESSWFILDCPLQHKWTKKLAISLV